MINKLLSVVISVTKEEKCISMLCSLPNSWDNLVVAIESNATTMDLDDVVEYLFL